MNIKGIIKRAFKYIFLGLPKVTILADIKTLSINKSLSGKTILITGGNRGLGASIVQRCLDSGAKVIVSVRNEHGILEAQRKFGEQCEYICLDLSMNTDFDSLWQNHVLKSVDTVIFNAGISLHEPSILDVSKKGWDDQFSVNLKNNYFLAQSFIKFRKGSTISKLIFISSERGLAGDDTPYGITKASINSLVKGLSNRYVDQGFIVNAIAPGVTASDMTGYEPNENLARSQSYGGRVFLAEEISEVVWFLISDISNCISGEVIACDHGSYLKKYY